MSKKEGIDIGGSSEEKEKMPSGPSNKLHIQVYRALMDAVVLDWTISLADKDRMKTCAVTYLSKDQNTAPTIIRPFMPQTRTFLLENLTPNQHYKFNMSCESDVGVHYSSESIEFSTLHLSSRNRLLSNPSQSPDYLMMNSHLKSLPAISNSIQDQQQDLPQSIKVVSTNLSNSRSYYTRRTSPHAVLGLSCAIFGAILLLITVGLALRRYSQHKRSQTRLWELHRAAAAQEAEISSMPTFINLPPPYSEQPSPLYNLCASSINSDHYLNHCCHHYQHLCFNQEASSSQSQPHRNKEVNNEDDTNSTADTTTDTTTTTT